jgi:ABC-type proline/glycine betaine transport system substrate-binding protein
MFFLGTIGVLFFLGYSYTESGGPNKATFLIRESTKEYIVPTYVMKVGYNGLKKIKEFARLNNPDGTLWICTKGWAWNVKKFSYK